jgi:predicted SnoaL-like aldol condensation-catalyzing enzyme
MSEHKSSQKQAFRRLIEEAISAGNPSVVDELLSEDFAEHQDGIIGTGPEGAKIVSRQLHAWFSDFTLTVEEMLEEGDTVCGRLKGRGVNTGSIMGHPPTNKRVEVDVIDIIRFKDGKMVAHWGVANTFGLLQQVGILPGPRRAAGEP